MIKAAPRLVLIGLLLSAAPVQARKEVTLSYPYSRVWTSAVRLMRVDFECNITEKDKDDGYFLFEYPDRGKIYPGSVELVASKHDDTESVLVVLKVPAMPSYVEAMILERLTRKLEQEFGPPKEPKDPKEKKPETPGEPDKKPETPGKAPAK